MNTIMILATALATAAKTDITRLDIQYNLKSEAYNARCWLHDSVFDIHEDGTIEKVKGVVSDADL